MTLGSLIKFLKVADPQSRVCYDFGYTYPHSPHSWRGVYSELAFDYSEGNFDEMPTVTDFLKMLETEVLGKNFVGWKGGDFVMDGVVSLHVAHSGESGHTAISSAIENYGYVILETRYDG